MIKLKHTEISDIHIYAKPGSSLLSCWREAVLLACLRWKNVTLTHQDRQYRVLCDDLIGCIKKPTDEVL